MIDFQVRADKQTQLYIALHYCAGIHEERYWKYRHQNVNECNAPDRFLLNTFYYLSA
jgi:hypothetical protein